jgi:hypothetical protein
MIVRIPMLDRVVSGMTVCWVGLSEPGFGIMIFMKVGGAHKVEVEGEE